jgi:CRISPR-associated endonuclease/helicase Cas3
VLVDTPDQPKTVQVAVEPLADNPEMMVRRALDAARSGARVLVLRNTVRDAVDTQTALEGILEASDRPLLFSVGDVLTLHHARFAREDRIRLDAAIDERFGKPKVVGGVVAVATQTVQQSLDLDADLMFTDLAPMDVLLQRFGRLHRHRERDAFRPVGFDRPRAVVLTADDPLESYLRRGGEARGRHGAGSVYDDLLILEATLECLSSAGELRIPAQNRDLVERTTHPEALENLATKLGGLWVEHLRRRQGRELAHRGIADLNVVERQRPFGEYAYEDDKDRRIATRLGEGDRRAMFASPPLGPFGAVVRELTLPAWFTQDAPGEELADPDLLPRDVRVDTGDYGPCLRFTFATLPFTYDRLGLRGDRPLAPAAAEDSSGP